MRCSMVTFRSSWMVPTTKGLDSLYLNDKLKVMFKGFTSGRGPTLMMYGDKFNPTCMNEAHMYFLVGCA